MSISDEISRLSGNISDSFGAVEDMGGTVPQNTNSDNLAAAIRSIPQPDTVTPESIAIVANGNTHGAITSGQYVYVRGHATLAEGLYTATAAIAANGTLSTANLAAVSSGGLNALAGLVNVKANASTVVTKTWPSFPANITAYANAPTGGYILSTAQATAMTDGPAGVDSVAYFLLPGTADEGFMLLIIPKSKRVYIRFRYGSWQDQWYRFTLT